jgi:hypothetical protein
MSSPSPIQAGFRQAFREPAIVLAEIAWRWSFALAALAIVIASVVQYLDSVALSNLEWLALGSGTPWLIGKAVAQILRASASRLAIGLAILLPAIAILWTAAAGLGRTAILKALLGREDRVPLTPQLWLHFLRASVMLASLLGYLGALIIAAHAAGGETQVRPGIFLIVSLILGAVISFFRSRLDWILRLASISALRNGSDAFTAIGEAVGLLRRNAAKFAATGAVFGIIHGVLFVFTAAVFLLVLSLPDEVPIGIALLLLLMICLAYFAAVDFLKVARLAAYVAIDEAGQMPPPAPVSVQSQPVPPPLPPEPLPASS